MSSPSLPTWNLASIYPSLNSPEYAAALQALNARLSALESALEQPQLSDFDAILEGLNAAHEIAWTLQTYTYGHVDTDSRDAVAQGKSSELDQALVPLEVLLTRFTAWVGTTDVDALLATSTSARDHEYFLRKAQVRSSHLMSPAEEALAAELSLTGSTAWGKLHNDSASQLEVDVRGQTVTMSQARAMAYDADRDLRRAAYEAELAGWKRWETPLAASLNGVKGEVVALTRRRGWASPLDESLFRANIDRQVLDAMLGAAREAMPEFRRYLKAKAVALGARSLEWFDLFAPVGRSSRSWEYGEACEFVASHFDSFSGKMGDFARRSYAESWIDAGPRPGKTDGAYCADVPPGDSRILMNFKPAFGSVKTLAHELGHAYHNLCLKDRKPLQGVSPMTLAETASTFCETIVAQAGIAVAQGADLVALLEGTLQGQCQVVVDITSRFEFESSLFEGRARRELSAAELCGFMEDSQRNTYGDGLSSYHPYMWAAKPHYYGTGSFYNYPYMFGLLFGLGLYAQYEKTPDAFRRDYDDLLSSTGMADAATLAARFGIDIRSADFWRGSLAVIVRDIERFESLTAQTVASA